MSSFGSFGVLPPGSFFYQSSGAGVSEALNVSSAGNPQQSVRNSFLTFTAVFTELTPFDFAFSVDPAASMMSLTTDSAASGEIRIELSDVPSHTTLLDYIFTKGIVTTSLNSLGITLPTVGSNAGFATSFNGINIAVPAFSLAQGEVLTLHSGASLSQSMAYSPPGIPEPASASLCTLGVVLIVLLGGFAKRAQKHTTARGV